MTSTAPRSYLRRPYLRLAGALLIGSLALGTAACAPSHTGDTYSRGQLQQASMVGYGTILSMRDVRVAGTQSGIGTAAGAVAGGIAGSAIGGGWRGPALAGIAGAVIGGIAGTAVERGVTQGVATEFIIREDGGQTIAVVQTNEQQLQPGERVVLLQGRELRIARAAGEYAPPPQPRRPAPSRTIPQRQSGGLKG